MKLEELNEEIIENMPYTPEKEIIKIQKAISRQLKQLSNKYKSEGEKDYHNKARCEINKKYGKGWRESLEVKKIYSESIAKNMNYYD